jgi:hypothetical protein
MSLRLDDTVQRYLISTTSRLVGEYEAEGVLITHVWRSRYDPVAAARWEPGPTLRSTLSPRPLHFKDLAPWSVTSQ